MDLLEFLFLKNLPKKKAPVLGALFNNLFSKLIRMQMIHQTRNLECRLSLKQIHLRYP